jgi:hypothetical protein
MQGFKNFLTSLTFRATKAAKRYPLLCTRNHAGPHSDFCCFVTEGPLDSSDMGCASTEPAQN